MVDSVYAQDLMDNLGNTLKTLQDMDPATRQELLGAATGLPTDMHTSMGLIVAGVMFGIIGFAAFLYGKKSQNWRALIIGLALMIYPYFVTNVWANYALGISLCVALYVWRE